MDNLKKMVISQFEEETKVLLSTQNVGSADINTLIALDTMIKIGQLNSNLVDIETAIKEIGDNQ